jgi:hypothetical protein
VVLAHEQGDDASPQPARARHLPTQQTPLSSKVLVFGQIDGALCPAVGASYDESEQESKLTRSAAYLGYQRSP